MELALADRPRLDREHVGADHGRSSSSERSCTTTSAPCARSASAWPVRSTPTTQPKCPARPASTPASASSNTAAWAGSAPSALAAGQERVGRRLPGEVLALGDDAVDPHLEQILDAGRDRARPGSSRSRTPPPGAAPCSRALRRTRPSLVRLDALVVDQLQHEIVLAQAEPVDRLVVGRVVRRARAAGRCPATRRNERTPSRARLAVDVLLVVVGKHELAIRLAGALVPAAQELVEHLLPRLGVDLRRLRQDAVEVEQAGGDAVGQAEHAGKLAASHAALEASARSRYLRSGHGRGARRGRRSLSTLTLSALDVAVGRGSRGRAARRARRAGSALWATRKSGPSFSRRSPIDVLSSITTSHSPGKSASTSLSSPSTDAASAVASSRRRSALGVAGLPGLLLLGLAHLFGGRAERARSAGRRCTSSRGPCGRRARGRARSSPARAPRRRRRARCRTRAARPTPRGRRASRTSSGRPSWSGSSWSR